MNLILAGSGLKRHARGFTLVELMISMLLGLLVVGSVIGVLLANKRSSGTNEGLAQVQESARTAYELMAHDIREADNRCGNDVTRTVSVLTATGLWWQNWIGLRGYDSTQSDPAVAIGTAVGERVAGTDSIHLESIDGAAVSIANHDSGANRLDLDAAASDFVAGDIMMVCDFEHTTIFQASAVATVAGVVSVFHNVGVGTPGNFAPGLGFPLGTVDPLFPPRNAQIGRLVVTDWYIGNNGRAGEGGRSLYRRRGSDMPEEIVAGVTDMQMRFRATDDDDIFGDASLVPDWNAISSVLIRITAQSRDTNVSTDSTQISGRIERSFNYLVSLRNRLP